MPTLVRVGKALVDPNDVAAIVPAGNRRGLFVIRLKSQPNPEFPLWATEADLQFLVPYFNIVEG